MEWEFVKEMMMALNYHTTFIQWVMECITTTSYSLAINEGLCENIEGKRGLRQGDPISPLIFVICIEYLLRIMEMVRQQKGIAYHPKYKSLGSNHLCFVDDVLLFCKGESQAIMLLIRDLASFSQTSGLTTNSPKSNIFSANMSRQQIFEICELTGYKEGRLTFKYIGVPISPKKLSSMDCEMLVEKMTSIIKTWGVEIYRIQGEHN